VLIAISGLPGTGKTAVAAGLAARLNAVHLSIDPIEDAMLGAGLPHGWETGVAAYEATRAAAEQNLVLGRDVVVDAVNDSDAARQTWRNAAGRTDVVLRFVMLNCSSDGEHQHRLKSRRRGLRHVPEPTWEQVLVRAAAYEPWTEDCLMVDTHAPLAAVIDEVYQGVANGA
jgi:predicted kinase